MSTHHHLTWDRRFLKLAELVSTWSKDPSTKVGAVIVNNRRHVVSLGYNGFPQAMKDLPADYADREKKYSRIVHGEINALIFAKGGIPSGSTLYTWPFLSCDRCAVQMIQAGIYDFVAPQPTPEQFERWGDAFKRSMEYINECSGRYHLIGRDFLDEA